MPHPTPLKFLFPGWYATVMGLTGLSLAFPRAVPVMGEMAGAVKKLREAGCDNVMLTERGTFFGYGRLVNDFIGVADMMELGGADAVPVCFDCTHSREGGACPRW